MANKAASLGTRVIINPGLYRESITLNGSKTLSTLPITFEAATNGTVVVTGAQQYTGWSTYSGNNSIYTNTWAYAWGYCAIDSGGPPLEQPVVLRREMVIVNGTVLTQVMSLSQMLFPGTFFVDETGGELYVWPPAGTNMTTADVEVGVNSSLLSITANGNNQITGIVIRGITFEYATSCHIDSAVDVEGNVTNILFDTDTFIWNNATGLNFNYPVADVTVMNSISNHNGASGFNTFQALNMLWQDDTASYNNWRGAQGAFYEWGSGGAHIFSDHNETLTNFTSTFNETHSLHWDTDDTEITVTNLLTAQNMFGALLEKNNGPMTFTSSTFCPTQVPTGTYGSGLILRDSLNVTVNKSTFYNNSLNQIEVTGVPGGFPITDWATQQTYQAVNKNFVFTNNNVQGATGQVLISDGILNGSDWTTFVTSLTSNYNTWWNATNPAVFVVPTPATNTDDDFAQWQTLTGQDTNSTWANPGAEPAACNVTADHPDFWLVVDNDVVTTDAAGNAVFNLTTLPLGGLTGTVTLAVDGVSSIEGASYTLNPSTTTTSGTSVLTFNAGVTTPPGSYAFTVLANTGNITRMITLSATVPTSSVRLSTDTLTFNNVPVGSTSAGLPITLTNTGKSPLTIDSITATYDYAETNNCGTSLPAGSSCTITVTFSPMLLQTYTGSLTITDADATSPQIVTLNGNPIGAPGITFSPKVLYFGASKFMSPTLPQTVTVTNNGTATTTISSVAVTGTDAPSYTQTNNCTSLVVNATCTISVIQSTTVDGKLTANLTVTDNVTGGPQTVGLNGTGDSALSSSPKSLGFGTVKNGQTATKNATLTNSGTAAVAIANLTMSGPNADDFSQTNNCGTTLAGNSSCTIMVTFASSTSGSETATLSINDADPSSPQTLSLSGTGKAVPGVYLMPVALTFNGQVYKSPSPSQPVTVTNNGNAVLNITKYSFTGTNGGDFSETNNCNGSVPAGSTCTINITFTPSGLGTRTATLSVSDNAAGSPQTVTLTGTGLPALTISPTSVDYGTVPVGSSGVQTVTITNTSTATISFTSATLSGPNSGDFSETNTCGKHIEEGASCTVTVTFKPQATGSRTATLTLTDLDPSSPQSVPLSGTGGAQPSVTFLPASLTFGNQVYETPSVPLTTTMTNTSSSAMSITTISVTGTNKSDFTQTNNCGTTLAQGASCAINVTFTPGSTGSRSATLSVTDDAVGSPQTVPLSGIGTTALTVSPTTLNYGTVTVNTSSSLPVTVTNSSAAAIGITSIKLGGDNQTDFSETNTCGTSIPANSSCTITVTFDPLSSGSKSATLTIRDSDPSSPQTVTLSGTGGTAAPGAVFSPTSLTFGSVVYLDSSPVMTTTLTNNGTASLNINSINITGAKSDYAQTNNCPGSLAQGSSCTINVTFTPLAIGSLSASVSVSDNAAGSPQTVSLSGTGLAALTLNPSSLSFGTVNVGSTSTQSLTIQNGSNATIAVTSFTFSGTNAGDFSQTNNCGTQIAGNGSCTVKVSFDPASAGSRSATMKIADSDPTTPQSVSLSGTGSGSASVTFSPTSLSFGNEPYEKSSAPLVTTMTNSGTATLSITSISVGGNDPADFTKSTTCGTSLAQGASCTITIVFVPTAIGARTATISVMDSVPGSPQTVPLSGTGVSALTISPTALSFGLVNVGTSATMQTTIANGSTAAIGITNMTFGGADPGDFSQTNTCGAKISGNGSCTITVTFKPSVTGARSASLMIMDSDPSSPQTVTLSGSGGIPGISVSPTSLTFPNQPLNKASAPMTLTVTSSGSGLLVINSVSITGPNKAEFSQTTNCVGILNPLATCTISVVFTPTSVGTRTASISIADNVGGSPQIIPLNGMGSAFLFTPPSIDFGAVTSGTTSTMTLKIQNVTSSTVTVLDHKFLGANAASFSGTGSCERVFAPNATCTITLSFTPPAPGTRTAQLQLDDNDPSTPQLVSLQGTGQ